MESAARRGKSVSEKTRFCFYCKVEKPLSEFSEIGCCLKCEERFGRNPLPVQPRRKKATRRERITPCEWCEHPLSQRHHLLPVSIYGDEQKYILRLCANCHELYHIVEKAKKQNKHALPLMMAFALKFGWDDTRLKKASAYVEAVHNAQERAKTNG